MRRCKCGFLVDADIDDEICPSCGGLIDSRPLDEDYNEGCGCQECLDVCEHENLEDDDEDYEEDDFYHNDNFDEDDEDDDFEDDEDLEDDDED